MNADFRNVLSRRRSWLVPPLLVVGAIIAWFALDPGFRGVGSNATTEMASDAFEQRVRDYLLKHPEVIMEAVQRLEARRRAAEDSEAQAKAALAAHRQARYVAFHEALMQARGVADEAGVLRIAAEVGLDVTRLKADMADTELQSAIDRNLKLAQALRIAGTPGFVIGEHILRGATHAATLRNLVDKARAEPPP